MAELSPRAQEILASVERDAAARLARGGHDVAASPSALLTLPPREQAIADPSRLLALVDAVAIGADLVQKRVDALNDAVDAVATRLGLQDETPPAEAHAPDGDGTALTDPGVLAAIAEVTGATLPPSHGSAPAELPAALQGVVSGAPGKPGALLARPPGEAEPPRPQAPPPAEVPAPPRAPAPHEGSSETARLVAVEMAVAGYPRNQVGDRLVRQYGITDPQPILDEVFGRGTTGDSRMPWT